MLQSDDAPELLRAFGRRDYLLSEAGQFEDSQTRVQDEERSARATDEATAWRRSLSAGDTIPGEADYDFAAMARDGVWPKPDGGGRVPLSPRYWKPGRMVVAGHDLATGRRVLSSAPLEERVLGDLPDETGADNIEQILAQAKPEDLAELSGVERNSLEAWAESHGLMLAQGGTQATQTDITNGTIGPIPRNQVQEVVGRLGSWIQRLATELDKAGISIPTPLENDPRISLKDITVGDLGKVLEDISFGFWPISGGNAATGGVGTFGLKTDALEVMNAAPAVGAAGKVMKKGAEALAPTAKEMLRKGAENLQSATGQRADLIAYHGTPHTFPPTPRNPLGEFDASKIGTGEGAQAFGHGIYFAESPVVAGSYKGLAARDPSRLTVDGKVVNTDTMYGRAVEDVARIGTKATLQKIDDSIAFNAKYAPDMAEQYRAVRKQIEALDPKRVSLKQGTLYHVDIPDSAIARMLDWDKPLSQQTPEVRKAVAPFLENSVKPYSRVDGTSGYWAWIDGEQKFFGTKAEAVSAIAERDTGADLVSRFSSDSHSRELFADDLRKAGVPGIRYLDQASRSSGNGTRNFVLFDPSLAKIVGKE